LEKFIPTRKIKVEYWYNDNISENRDIYDQLVKDNKEYFREFVNDIDKIETKFNASCHVEPIKERKDNRSRNNV